MKAKLTYAAKYIWRSLSRHTILKILSLLFAILLWSYVVSSDTSITRTKTIDNLTGYVTGQSTIETYGIALLTDPTDLLKDISVNVAVPRADYTSVSADGIQVSLDVSSVRTTGTREVKLKATTNYGKVVDIHPASITLTFEKYDSRIIPVNVNLLAKEMGYWYSTSRVNPSTITVSGATSVVQSVASAAVYADMSGRTDTFITAQDYVLLDANEETINQNTLTRSASSISLMVEVYPTKEIPISNSAEDVLVGTVAEGYQIQSITTTPETVTVAADADLLARVDKLIVEPIEIDNVSQSFTRRASITGLSDFKYVSSEQVYVTVQIAEERVTTWIDNVNVTFLGKAEGLEASWQKDAVKLRATGPRSQVAKLANDGITVMVDVSYLGEGTYTLPVLIDSAAYPDIEFEADTDTINVTLTKTEEN